MPDTLPAGVTLAPASDPRAAARAIAERIGGELVVDVAAAERALGDERSRRRAAQVVADAAEAARLCARLAERGAESGPERAESAETSVGSVGFDASEVARLAAVAGDVVADPDELTAAAARLRSAAVRAEAAARAVGDRPSTLAADLELVRARSLVADLDGDVTASSGSSGGRGGAAAGVLAMSAGGALLLVSAGAPVVAGATVPALALGGIAVGHRRLRRDEVRRRAERDAAVAGADRAHGAWVRAVDAAREWQARADAADAADAELGAARTAWVGLVGSDDVPVERVERLADARRRLVDIARALDVDPATPASQLAFEVSRRASTAASERDELQARLRELLHGRRLDRLRAEADAARALLAATPPVSALVLCDPFAAVGRHRRRELLETLERVASDVTLAVVTSDDEAIAWAAARSRSAPAATPF